MGLGLDEDWGERQRHVLVSGMRTPSFTNLTMQPLSPPHSHPAHRPTVTPQLDLRTQQILERERELVRHLHARCNHLTALLVGRGVEGSSSGGGVWSSADDVSIASHGSAGRGSPIPGDDLTDALSVHTPAPPPGMPGTVGGGDSTTIAGSVDSPGTLGGAGGGGGGGGGDGESLAPSLSTGMGSWASEQVMQPLAGAASGPSARSVAVAMESEAASKAARAKVSGWEVRCHDFMLLVATCDYFLLLPPSPARVRGRSLIRAATQSSHVAVSYCLPRCTTRLGVLTPCTIIPRPSRERTRSKRPVRWRGSSTPPPPQRTRWQALKRPRQPPTRTRPTTLAWA